MNQRLTPSTTGRGWSARLSLLLAGTAVVAVAVGAVGLSSPVGAQSDIDGARAGLTRFVGEYPPAPFGAPTPRSGPGCPVVAPSQVLSAAVASSQANAATLDVDVDPWFGYAASDADVRTIDGRPLVVVRCVADRPDAGVTKVDVIAIDTGPAAVSTPDIFERVARRFGVSRAVRVTPPGIGGEITGTCRTGAATSVCVALWQRGNLVLGVTVTGPATDVTPASTANLLVALVPGAIATLSAWTPPTTTTTSTTTTTTTTTLPPTTTSSTTTTLPPTTSTTSTTTTLPPTTSTTSTTTTLPPTTTTSSTTTSTTTTLPPTSTTSSTTTSTTTTLPPTTTTTTTTTLPATTTTTLPPTTTTLPATTTTVPLVSVWETLLADPDLSELASAIQTADLVDVFDGPEIVTVFAPTNDAIADIVDWPAIVADPVALERFVLAHTFNGMLTTASLFPDPPPATVAPVELDMLSGDLLVVDFDARTISGVSILTPDLLATNGLIHTVETVLLVPELTPATTLPAEVTEAPPEDGPADEFPVDTTTPPPDESPIGTEPA